MRKVADFFCGMGGLSYGFSKYFDVTGFDINRYSKPIFKKNKIGNVREINLNNIKINPNTGLLEQINDVKQDIDADIMVGGPSCKPWSSVNVTKRNITSSVWR